MYHSYYGCETGCCGHVVEIDTEQGTKSKFDFVHPYGEKDLRAWARSQAESVIRHNWPECVDSIDWESMDIKGVDSEDD